MNENNTGTMDMTVKVFPVQSSKNLLATASVKGEYHDICFPTTAEMRQAIQTAVLGEYERTTQRSSVLSAMREAQPKPGRAHEGAKGRNVETR